MFAKSEVRASGLLQVDDLHEIYWEEAGNPDGIPAIHLHGGPGGTLNTGGYRRRFDPARFRIIGIDQRGCGRSRPHVTAPGYDLMQNTTAHLINDLEAVREHLDVERWLVSGVSWGCTLALAYSQEHPNRVLGVTMMAIATTDRFYVDWISEHIGVVFPEAWDRLAGHAERAGIGFRRGGSRVIEAYAQLMTHPDPGVRDEASIAWRDWEDHHISLGKDAVVADPRFEDADFRQVYGILVTHYWAHDSFLEPPILERMSRLTGIPGTLIHGRRDVSGPAVAAWQLHRSWPGSELYIEEREGHGGPEMVRALCTANSSHADRIESEQQAEMRRASCP